MITDRKIAKPAAHRTAIAAADAGPDISDSTGALTLQDQIHVAAILECSAGGVTGSLCHALWDKDGVFMGITETQSFTADSTWRNGINGGYVTPALIFDVMGASKVKALVKSISGGNITNLYLVPLAFRGTFSY
ncbi:MAG: hypothetical protein AB1423_14475 [Pseudomonadota bacterium]